MGRKSIKWRENKLINKDQCFECGSNNKLHFHHVVPVIFGGNNTIPLCEICHGKVHDHNFLRIGNLVKHAKNKSETPIKKNEKSVKKVYDELTYSKKIISLDLDTDEKIKLANKLNGIFKKNDSIRKILEAKQHLKKYNQKTISSFTNLSLATVKRYYRYKSEINVDHILKDYNLNESPFTNITKTIIPRKDVTTYR